MAKIVEAVGKAGGKGTTDKPPVKAQPVIVEAVGIAGGKGYTSKEIEEAMAKAVQKARAEGITDPEQIRAKMMEAREAVKERYRTQPKG